MNYENPWADHRSFIDLGTFVTYEREGGKVVIKNHDLYILWNPEKETIYDVDIEVDMVGLAKFTKSYCYLAFKFE